MVLDAILDAKRLETEERAAARPLSVVREAALGADAPRDFLAALRGAGFGVIAEVKRASPSKGAICPELDAATLARQYERGGAAAISVLTDGPYFGARAGDLESARGAVAIPVLRKDFVLTEYQLFESRAMGADAVLLIVAALGERELPRLLESATALGMCPLVEVHSPLEVGLAVECGAEVIGINNRDLATFEVDLETTRRLIRLIPSHVTVVSESGIAGRSDAELVKSWGADAVLVGEALVRSGDPTSAIRELTSPSTVRPGGLTP